MKKIIITEDQLKTLMLVESAGVPNNLISATTNVVNEIFNEFEKNKDVPILNGLSLDFDIMGDFTIGNFKTNKLDVKIKVVKQNIPNIVIDELEMVTSMKVDDYNFKIPALTKGNSPTKEEYISIVIKVPITNQEIIVNDILLILKRKYNWFYSSMAHELKHRYDDEMTPVTSLVKDAEYQTFNYQTSLPPIDEFIFAMYYTSDKEISVKNSEVFALLKAKNIKKSEFYRFLKENETYQTLNKYKDLKFDNILLELEKKYMDRINLFLENVNNKPSKKSNKGKINEVLKLIYGEMKDTKIESLYASLIHGNKTIDLSGRKLQFYEKQKDKINSIKVMDFFYNKQTEINLNANRALRKMAKLYSLLLEMGNKNIIRIRRL